MNHVVVLSDLHLHAFEPFSGIDPETGVNTRLLDGIKILRQIRKYCIDNKISTVLNGGDLVHKGSALATDLLELLIVELAAFRQAKIRLISISGQHDFKSRSGEFSVPKALAPLMTVLNSPGEYVDINKDIRVVGCSYRDGIWDQKEMFQACKDSIDKDKKNIFLGHFLVKEILEADGVKYDAQSVCYEDLPKGFSWYLLGDYHVHLSVSKLNLTSIGPPNQHTFGDKNRPQGGFLDLDLKTLKFRRIETDAPMFVTVSPDEDFPGDYQPGNFYNVQVKDDKQQDRIKAKLGDEWRVAFPKVLEDEDDTPNSEEARISISMEPEEILARYVEYFGLSKKHLEKGLSYLEGT